MRFTIFIGILIAVAGFSFAFQNTQVVDLQFLFWTFKGSLFVVLSLALLLGIIIAGLIGTPIYYRRYKKSRLLKKDIKALNQKVSTQQEELRTLKTELTKNVKALEKTQSGA